MNLFVFRNNTVENLFGNKGVAYSGYGDISFVPKEADTYVWCYQVPIKFNQEKLLEEIDSLYYNFVLLSQQIPDTKPFIVLTLSSVFQIDYTDDDFHIRDSINRFNERVVQLSSERRNIKILDFNDFLSSYPEQELIDWKYYFISQMIFSPKLVKPFQKWWQRKLNEINLERKKCIVLDLDNTLWGGVLGEDGVDGVKIAGDYPGKAYLYFQEALLELASKGIILAVCSKNNEEDVLELWKENPYMAITKDAISAYRINWQDKATNIKALSEELNIGLDSMVFIDDNPTERELIKQVLPMVAVPDFPTQPYMLIAFFKQLVNDYFKVYSITEEDKKKTEQYKANALRSQSQNQFLNYEDFLASLHLELTIMALDSFNLSRIAQMTQKTNQFNLTTKRYSETDIKKLERMGWKIWCLSVSDKFGDNGITGLIMITPQHEIDTLLLSCRILGKGIEYAFVKYVLSMIKNSGIDCVTAQYVSTPKNGQTANFYDNCGFSCIANESGSKQYELLLNRADLNIKKYYHIIS